MGSSLSRAGATISSWMGLADAAMKKAIDAMMQKNLKDFNERQEVLERILNRGRPLIDAQPHLGHIKMPIAPRGKGKSTVCNIFEVPQDDGVPKFETGDTLEDVTVCMEAKVFPDKVIVDTVGMDVTLENIGKIFLLFFIHGIFPDYFIHIDDVRPTAPARQRRRRRSGNDRRVDSLRETHTRAHPHLSHSAARVRV